RGEVAGGVHSVRCGPEDLRRQRLSAGQPDRAGQGAGKQAAGRPLQGQCRDAGHGARRYREMDRDLSRAVPMSAAGLVDRRTPTPARATWLGALRADQRLVIAVLVGAVLAVLMLPPLWILIQDSLTTTDAIGDVTGWTLV